MYFHLTAGGTTSATVPLRSPGDVYLTTVSEAGGEYSMTFALCDQVYGYFNHVKELSEAVQALLADVPCEQWNSNPANICAKNLEAKISAGTVLGGVGALQGNFDFGAYDYRVRHNFANPERYRGRSPTIVCPLDLYDSPVREELFSKVARTAQPLCGQVMQDVPGTLQGNWFYGDVTAESTWNQHLAFVPDNHDPATSVISVGGQFMSPTAVRFQAQMSGQIDRQFHDVAADGSVYCYRDGPSGRIVLEMTSDVELLIERQAGACSAGVSLSSPATYRR